MNLKVARARKQKQNIYHGEAFYANDVPANMYVLREEDEKVDELLNSAKEAMYDEYQYGGYDNEDESEYEYEQEAEEGYDDEDSQYEYDDYEDYDEYEEEYYDEEEEQALSAYDFHGECMVLF